MAGPQNSPETCQPQHSRQPLGPPTVLPRACLHGKPQNQDRAQETGSLPLRCPRCWLILPPSESTTTSRFLSHSASSQSRNQTHFAQYRGVSKPPLVHGCETKEKSTQFCDFANGGHPLARYDASTPPPPLRKHQPGQESDGQTGSWCLDKAVQPRNARYQKKACPKNLPIPHSKHDSRNRALEHNVQANFSKFWRSSLPIRGIRNCACEG